MNAGSSRPRRSGILLAAVGGLVLLAVPWFTSRADVDRLLGRTTGVQATVTEVATLNSRNSGFPRYSRQQFTVTWPDPSSGATITGKSIVITRDGAGHDLGQTVPAQWVPGTDAITVATTWQSVIVVGWPLAAGAFLLVVAIVVTWGARRLRRRRGGA